MNLRVIDRENLLYLVEKLEQIDKDKAIRSGLRAAIGVLIRGGRRRLNQRLVKGKKGDLRSSFTTRVKRRKLGALAGFGAPRGNHSHLVDRGTRMRYTEKGASRGIMPANRFWEDTRIQDEGKAMSALQKGIEKAVERINHRM